MKHRVDISRGVKVGSHQVKIKASAQVRGGYTRVHFMVGVIILPTRYWLIILYRRASLMRQ